MVKSGKKWWFVCVGGVIYVVTLKNRDKMKQDYSIPGIAGSCNIIRINKDNPIGIQLRFEEGVIRIHEAAESDIKWFGEWCVCVWRIRVKP